MLHMLLLPHDFTALKWFVGRLKDLNLLAYLQNFGFIDTRVIRSQIDLLDIPLERFPPLHEKVRDVFERSAEYTGK
jgi:hypothetical protein